MDNTNLQRCRTCLAEDHKLIPLSVLSVAKLHLSDILMTCASIQIVPNDGFSQYACSECIISAEKAYFFRIQCEQSNELWNQFSKYSKKQTISTSVTDLPPTNLPDENQELDSECERDQGDNDPEITETKSVEIHDEVDNGPEITETGSVETFNEIENDSDIRSIEIHEEFKIEKFNCKYCFKILRDKAKLSMHELAHTIEPKILTIKQYATYGCRECFVDRKTSVGFTEHCYKSHQESLETLYYRCKLCAGDFADLIKLTKHVSTRHDNKLNSISIVRHRNCQKRLLRSSTFSCQYCGTMYPDEAGLIRHKFAHKIEPKNLVVKQFVMYSCQECFIDIDTPDGFIEHCHTLHKGSIENLYYYCKLCVRGFPGLFKFAAHVERIHQKPLSQSSTHKKRLSQSSTWPQTCSYCTLQLKSCKEKIVHNNQEHSDLKNFSCDKCGKKFFCKSSLQIHSEIHKEKSYMCQYCGKSLTSKSSLIVHIRTHTGERPFKCKECNARFVSRTQLNGHLFAHVTENNLECGECPKKFKRAASLKSHMRTHTLNAPKYSCHLCPKQMKWSAGLRRHLKTHTNECPYVCKVCNKAFNCRSNLKVHMKTHTGEKPYVCTICKQAFGYAHCLRSHTAKFHKDNTTHS